MQINADVSRGEQTTEGTRSDLRRLIFGACLPTSVPPLRLQELRTAARINKVNKEGGCRSCRSRRLAVRDLHVRRRTRHAVSGTEDASIQFSVFIDGVNVRIFRIGDKVRRCLRTLPDRIERAVTLRGPQRCRPVKKI